MRGKIEVYRSYGTEKEEVLVESQNTVVDGAGEILSDIMTAHTSLSGIPDLSSILDTSNYTIQAISFGKDVEGYNRHAHEITTRKGFGAYNPAFTERGSRIVVIQSEDITVSSYAPSDAGNILPSFVTPRQTQLELDTITSGTIYNSADPPVVQIPSFEACCPGITDIGHNLNVLWDAGSSSLAANESIYTSGFGGLLGCYPNGSGAYGTEFYAVSSDNTIVVGNGVWDDSSSLYTSSYNGLFNQVSSMDLSGFVNFVGSSTDAVIAAGWSGLTVSANTTIDAALHASNTGEIAYKVILGSGDVGSCNLYGGIYNIGLWAMDLCKAQKYNNPPFVFHPITNQKRHKLFSKKSLLDNICRTTDGEGPPTPGCLNHENLTLIWRLYFI